MQTLILICALAAGALYPDGVILPAEGFGERASLVENGQVQQLAGGAQNEFAEFIGSQLPASDRSKWYLTVYVDRLEDPESRLLLRDFDQHPALAKLKTWCKFQMVDKRGAPSAEARMLANEIAAQAKPIPTILLYANPDDPIFGREAAGGWRYVYQGSGYGGDAEALARNLYESIRAEYRRRGVEQCPGPYCPNPQPNLPEPSPYQPSPDRPHTEPYHPPRDDWTPSPFPRMDETPRSDPARLPFGLTEERLLIIAAIAFGIFIAWRRGLFDKPAPPAAPAAPAAKPAKQPPAAPPGGGAAALLLAGLLGFGCPTALTAAAATEQPNQTGAAEARATKAAEPVGQLNQPNRAEAAAERFFIDGPVLAPGDGESCPPCEIALFDRIGEAIARAVRFVKLLAYGLVGLGVANLLIGLRILGLLKPERKG